MPSARIRIADGVAAGSGAPLLLIAGPDVIESEAHALRMAQALKGIAAARGIVLVYKSSFDKANRTSAGSFRGPGLAEGVAILERVKKETGLPVTTDFHTPEQAEEVHADLRSLLQSRYNSQVASQIRIQYGGSVNADNAASLLSQPNIDGALVGGASLKAETFLGIVAAARR